MKTNHLYGFTNGLMFLKSYVMFMCLIGMLSICEGKEKSEKRTEK